MTIGCIVLGTEYMLQFVCLCLQSLNDREEFAASVLASQDSEIAQYPFMCVISLASSL